MSLKDEYWKIANDLLEYMDRCARRGMRPLVHDVNVYRARLNQARRRGEGK